jgi:hypothetical protein
MDASLNKDSHQADSSTIVVTPDTHALIANSDEEVGWTAVPKKKQAKDRNPLPGKEPTGYEIA